MSRCICNCTNPRVVQRNDQCGTSSPVDIPVHMKLILRFYLFSGSNSQSAECESKDITVHLKISQQSADVEIGLGHVLSLGPGYHVSRIKTMNKICTFNIHVEKSWLKGLRNCL